VSGRPRAATMATRAHAGSADLVVAMIAAVAASTPAAMVQGKRSRTSLAWAARVTNDGNRIMAPCWAGPAGNLGVRLMRGKWGCALANDRAHLPPCVVIGGDLNDAAVGQLAWARGYVWPAEHGPATTRLGRLDHIFLKGLAPPDGAAAGTVLDVGGASDHLAVWAVGILR